MALLSMTPMMREPSVRVTIQEQGGLLEFGVSPAKDSADPREIDQMKMPRILIILFAGTGCFHDPSRFDGRCGEKVPVYFMVLG
jgi:hypothetical protein